MKREDLKKLGLADEVIDSVMALHGTDIEAHKSKVTDLQAQFDGTTAQLTDANKQIESFKNLKPEELQKAADDWKAKFEQAQTDAANQLAQVKFEHALDGALLGAKAKNAKAVKALLSTNDLKLTEDGKILGLDEQLTKIRTENDYLFEGEKKDPKLVTGTNSKSVVGDPVIIATRKAAGLPIE